MFGVVYLCVVGNNHMTLRFILSTIFALSIIHCTNAQKLTIAFTQISSLEKGAKVYAKGRQIGYVTDIKPNKNIDTLFVTVKITQNIKIPKESNLYLDENLLGPSRITVEYSNQTGFLTSKDISIGIFRPLKPMTQSQLDSAKLDIKKLRSPTIDSTKHN
jgi:preprotein translocase subunit YajC